MTNSKTQDEIKEALDYRLTDDFLTRTAREALSSYGNSTVESDLAAGVIHLIQAKEAAEAGLRKANDGFEEYERRYYLTLDRAEAAERRAGEAEELLRTVQASTSPMHDSYYKKAGYLYRVSPMANATHEAIATLLSRSLLTGGKS